MSFRGILTEIYENLGFAYIVPDDSCGVIIAYVKECPDLEKAQECDVVTCNITKKTMGYGISEPRTSTC